VFWRLQSRLYHRRCDRYQRRDVLGQEILTNLGRNETKILLRWFCIPLIET
jgi:hypothetical protein